MSLEIIFVLLFSETYAFLFFVFQFNSDSLMFRKNLCILFILQYLSTNYYYYITQVFSKKKKKMFHSSECSSHLIFFFFFEIKYCYINSRNKKYLYTHIAFINDCSL